MLRLVGPLRSPVSSIRLPFSFSLSCSYALSRFPKRYPGAGRTRPTAPLNNPTPSAMPHEESPSGEDSQLWHTSQRPPASDPEQGLHRLLMESDTLVIER